LLWNVNCCRYTAECAKTCLAHQPQSPPGAAVTKRCAFEATNTTYYTCKCPYRAIVKSGNFTDNFPAFLSSGLRGSVSNALLTLKVGLYVPRLVKDYLAVPFGWF
jgi:hypothetical protein